MPIKTYFETLVEQHGRDYAVQYMRDIRKKVKKHPGGSFNDREFAKKAAALAVEKRRQRDTDTI